MMENTWVSSGITRTNPTHLPKEFANNTLKYFVVVVTLIKRVKQLNRPELSARIHPTNWKSTNDRFERA